MSRIGKLGTEAHGEERSACAAMEAVPVRIPKFIASPIASGPRPFSLFIGNKMIYG